MRKAKFPPYVELAIVKLKEGNFEDVDSVTDIILNNLTKDTSNKKGRIGKWCESMKEYWTRVFVYFMDAMREALKKNKTQWKVYQNYVESRLKGHVKNKS